MARTPLDEWRADAETSENEQHSRQTDIHDSSWFETAKPASQRSQIHALDSAATKICTNK